MTRKRREPLKILPFAVTAIVVAAVLTAFWMSTRRKAPPLPPAPPMPAVELPPARPEILDSVVLTPSLYAVPGARPSSVLRYRRPGATNVAVSGSWDQWLRRAPMQREGNEWRLDLRPFGLSFGEYAFKFLPDGKWEPGENRSLFVNADGLMERPLDIIQRARLEKEDRVDIVFKDFRRDLEEADVRILPHTPIRECRWIKGGASRRRVGYSIDGEHVTFCMDETSYEISIPNSAVVTVAGSFNGWDANSRQWRLQDDDDDDLWEGTFAVPYDRMDQKFKFVVDGSRWLAPSPALPNASPDEDGNVNLRIDATLARSPVLQVYTDVPLALSNRYVVALEDIGQGYAVASVSPGKLIDRYRSEEEMGVILDRVAGTTTYRVFAPRASRVTLCLFDRHAPVNGAGNPSEAATVRVPLVFDALSGTWDVVRRGLDSGRYYAFRVGGPDGKGEGFSPRALVGDPYARAVAHAPNHGIVIDHRAPGRWFRGWTDQAYRAPDWEDVVIYETHVRDLTIDPSSGVESALRGKYAGITASLQAGTALAHLKQLGVNMIEFLPLGEFENGTDDHGWGYSTAFYFAPEASYGRAPLEGSQYFEFKQLVDDLHREGFGVILDVVYNHVGESNPFYKLDRKYYFRMTPDFRMSNYSGCGNDVRTEAPMMRRLIVDNILYWMREFHVDGFRFDLAELIDMDTLIAIRDAARRENPRVLLISEPWSFRGDHKYQLKGTGWAAWNDEFRDSAKHYAMGHGDREALKRAIVGSVATWTAGPLQTVNYLESHDDFAFADEISSQPARDARTLSDADAARNRLAATVLFTSLGIPMIAEGQEFLRSKHGIKNSYNKGDAVNALNWSDRERPIARETLAYYRGLVLLRRSDAGAAFRVAERAPDDYYEWIEPPDGRALGYIVNGQRRHRGGMFIVLLNAAEGAVTFRARFPKGSWRLVGDGTMIDVSGIRRLHFPDSAAGSHSISVPGLTTYILMRE